LVDSMTSAIKGRIKDLSQKGQAASRMIRASTNALLARISSTSSARVVSVKETTIRELPPLPDDVFATMPAPVVVIEHRDTPRFDELPDNVFASELSENHQLTATTSAPAVNAAPVALEKPEVHPALAQSSETAPRVARSGFDAGRLNQAVSLTRDAAVAWMKILSGPAVVTLTR
jgi:hypothetical protein